MPSSDGNLLNNSINCVINFDSCSQLKQIEIVKLSQFFSNVINPLSNLGLTFEKWGRWGLMPLLTVSLKGTQPHSSLGISTLESCQSDSAPWCLTLQGIRDMRELENVPAALSRPRSPMFPSHSLLCSVGMDERGASRHTGWQNVNRDCAV